MTTFAFTLVLIAAFVHATWNLLAKQAGGGPAFVWLFSALSVFIYLPLVIAVIIWQNPQFTLIDYIFFFGNAVLHLAYFLMLQRGYKHGDLSLIYPLARGTGPTLSTLAAILFLGERPTGIALLGGLLVIAGIFILTGGSAILQKQGAWRSVAYGLLTGTVIAGYTLWDSYAVSVLLIPPLVLDYASTIGRTVLLTPYAVRHQQDVRHLWHSHRRKAVGVAVLGSLSYILVLTALTFTPVSYVAPAREMSVLIAVIMGASLLKEGNVAQRLVAAGLILVGVVTLALN